MRAAFTLTPAESKRLIAKAVVKMPEMQRALENAYVIINGSTTVGYVVQELLGKPDFKPHYFAKGIYSNRLACVTHEDYRETIPIVIHKGEVVDQKPKEALHDFHIDTVILKGANAIDHKKRAGVCLGGFDGGGMGKTVGLVVSQGLKYIVPVGLEKMVPSVPKAAEWTGAKTYSYSMGADFGLMVLPNAIPVTEIDALQLLAGVQARHVASGGIGEAVGAVTLVAEGGKDEIAKCIEIIESVKGEPPLPNVPRDCANCRYACLYKGTDQAQRPDWLNNY